MTKLFRFLFFCALTVATVFAISSCAHDKHRPADPVKENEVAATCLNGSYDEVIYCERCGDEISRKTKRVSAVASHTVENGVCTHCDNVICSEGLELQLNLDGVSYTLIGIGTCDDEDIFVGFYNALPVTRIAENALYNCTEIKSVTLGEGVTAIPHNAFKGCTSLEALSIPSTVTRINLSSFLYCTALKSITVDSANEAYKSIDGNLYTKDGSCLLQYAIGKTDTSFVILDGVTSIGDEAFASCANLISVTISDTVQGIGGWAFFNCTSLKNIKYRGTKEMWESVYKDAHWDFWYEDYGSYEKINYTITYNYTGK